MKDFATMKPREVEAYLREVVRKTFGDKTENAATITSSHGYYNVYIDHDKRGYRFLSFRKTEAKQIAKAIRALRTLHREPQ